MTKNLIKIHGGKYRIRKYLAQYLPNMGKIKRLVSPFVGGGSFEFLLLDKYKFDYILFNDLDNDLMNLYEETRDNVDYLVYNLECTRYDESIFNIYKKLITDIKTTSAIKKFVLSRMSRGGLCKNFGTSSRLRGGQNEYKNAWENAIKELPKISKKLQDVETLSIDAVALLRDNIRDFDFEDVLLYIDPPYLLSTRTAKKCYSNEMDDSQHEELLQVITQYKNAKIMLSGYPSDLYDRYLNGINHTKPWERVELLVTNNSGQSKTKSTRTEVIWRNYNIWT